MAVAPLARRRWQTLDLAQFLAGAVLIDFDHYLSYVVQTGDLSLIRAYRYHRREYSKPRRWRFRPHWPPLGLQPARQFHSVPVLIAVFAITLRWPRLRPFFWGMLLHRVQDDLWAMVE